MDTFEGGFYGSNEFRKQYHDFFEGKLWKGETVYYEIVGFTHDGKSIMGQCSNKKLNDKEFVKALADFAKDSTVIYNVITEIADTVVLEISESDRENIAKGIEEYYAESGKTEKERTIFESVAKIFGVEVTLQ